MDGRVCANLFAIPVTAAIRQIRYSLAWGEFLSAHDDASPQARNR
ncbi:hypothetical protein FP2506_01680 [Fulvimarina pelagi HTCC2506]|uniref:Uncharacterized protein n=1 Tax=Fulvimarina pelagi HTCC2506 TaxID=314231 RepID=Q0G1W1_9HYPH|nr:hypothetical protein FP2506_01680 [Fulvimarina pelagi HTCC2506]